MNTTIKRHLQFWIGYLCFDILQTIASFESPINNPQQSSFLLSTYVVALGLLPKLATFYVFYGSVLTPILNGKGNKVINFLLTIVIVTMGLLAHRSLGFFVAFPLIFNIDIEQLSFFSISGIMYTLFDLMIPSCLLTIYCFYHHSIALRERQTLLEKEQVKSELEFLKVQINPHFLFNTLNNFFSIAQKNKVPELEIGISGLADMMRFMIYETNSGLIELNKEIQYIKNYIDVYKLRLDEKEILNVEFSIIGNTDNIRLIPFILIPLAENALKHGIVFKKISHVKMIITASADHVEFYVKNTNYAQSNTTLFKSSGFGLKNLKRRLELTYPNKHLLCTVVEDGYYIATLSISLV